MPGRSRFPTRLKHIPNCPDLQITFADPAFFTCLKMFDSGTQPSNNIGRKRYDMMIG